MLLKFGLASAIATALPPRATQARDSLDTADVNALLARHKVPGARALIIENGTPVWSQAYGTREAGGTEPVDAATRFQVASITKTLNGLLVLAMARDGQLDLDAAANRYLSGWQLGGMDADTVTIAMLLSHTGGTSVSGFRGYAPGSAIPSVEQILDGATPANSPKVQVVRQPGKSAEYSGGGTTVLQKLVADVAGEPYGQLLRRLVLDPLGMTQSSIDQPPAAGLTNRASGHDRQGRTLPGGYVIHPELAAAGLWSTPTDLVKPIKAIIDSVRGSPGAFLPQALAKRMITPVIDGIALGVFSDEPGWFYHAGGNQGFRSFFRADCTTGNGIFVMCNGDNGAEVNVPLRRLMRASRDWD
jgi:CubicO group peptidase (beta-lactamase class C family)